MLLLRLSLFVLASLACHAALLGFYGSNDRDTKIERAAGGASIELGDPFDAAATLASEATAPDEIIEAEPPVEEFQELITDEPLEPNLDAILPLVQVPAETPDIQETKEIVEPIKQPKLEPQEDLVKDKEHRQAADEILARKKGASEKSNKAQTAEQIGNDGEQTDVAGLAEKSNYRGKIYDKLRKHRLNWRAGPGKASVKFTVQNDGTLSELLIEKTSGKSRFDKALVKLIKAAAPFPRFPEGLYAKSIPFSVTFSF